MIVKCELFTEDILEIHRNMDTFKKMFPRFEVIGKSLIVDDGTEEWDGEPEDMYEVGFNFVSMNNFWMMAKMIGAVQRTKGIL